MTISRAETALSYSHDERSNPREELTATTEDSESDIVLDDTNPSDLFYIALGDSLTAGIGSSVEDYLRLNAFVPQLVEQLRSEQGVYVENHGIPGITSGQLLTYLQEGPGMTQKLNQANLITITIGGNDLLSALNTEDIDENHLQTRLQQYRKNLSTIIEHIVLFNDTAAIYVMDLYLPFPEEHALHETGTEVIPTFNAIVQDVVEAYTNVHRVSVYDTFYGHAQDYTHINEQDVHPNDEGYRLIADAFYETISD
ncbi:GDSL-type esterase/lipase family protein [Caldalkalibacillus salinus]|uniref:GDSL-type esterase/lipase family protein n=1 Tax=Caldalkalibacillus salinus TaxID=2803787 RepID=UPI0019250272